MRFILVCDPKRLWAWATVGLAVDIGSARISSTIETGSTTLYRISATSSITISLVTLVLGVSRPSQWGGNNSNFYLLWEVITREYVHICIVSDELERFGGRLDVVSDGPYMYQPEVHAFK